MKVQHDAHSSARNFIHSPSKGEIEYYLNPNNFREVMPINTKVPKTKYITGGALWDMDIESIPTLVNPFLPQVGLAAIAGGSDTGKSALMKQLCLQVCAGSNEFLEYELTSRFRSAIYIATEDFEPDLAIVLKKQARKLEYGREAAERLRYIIDEEDLITNLNLMLYEQKADIIVIDTFTDVLNGDLNNNIEVRKAMNEFRQLAINHQCLIVFIHHTGKGREEEIPSKNNINGSGAFEAKNRMVSEFRTDCERFEWKHFCIVKGNGLSREWKTNSIVLKFDEPSMTFSKEDVPGVPFDKLAKKKSNDEKVEPTFTVDPDKTRWRKGMIAKATDGNDKQIWEAAGCRDAAAWQRLCLKAEKQNYHNSMEW